MSAEGLERQTRNYLSSNVPQIQQHGDNFEVRDIDESEGTATVAIGGACSGCGIAPMTMKAIERRLPESVDGLEDVEVVPVRRAARGGHAIEDRRYGGDGRVRGLHPPF